LLIYLIFVGSLAVLLLGSEWLIDSAEKIGLSFGISSFIIGVTIVAFGTSLPELATSIAAVHAGTSEIVIANVIGSNIANILLVLGITAIVGKGIKLDFNIMDVDIPLLIISAIFLYFTCYDLHLSFFECILMLIGLGIFLLNSVSGEKENTENLPKVTAPMIVKLIFGGLAVYFGATFTINSLTQISVELGISPDVIALTAIALGTSLPEVIVSMAAARKGKHAIAVGNVLGSNIFNTYAVMTIPSFLGDLKIPEHTLYFSLPFMVAVTFLFSYAVMSNRVSKWEGYMLVLLYVFYISEVI